MKEVLTLPEQVTSGYSPAGPSRCVCGQYSCSVPPHPVGCGKRVCTDDLVFAQSSGSLSVPLVMVPGFTLFTECLWKSIARWCATFASY